jgi:hypothetical protein
MLDDYLGFYCGAGKLLGTVYPDAEYFPPAGFSD